MRQRSGRCQRGARGLAEGVDRGPFTRVAVRNDSLRRITLRRQDGRQVHGPGGRSHGPDDGPRDEGGIIRVARSPSLGGRGSERSHVLVPVSGRAGVEHGGIRPEPGLFGRAVRARPRAKIRVRGRAGDETRFRAAGPRAGFLHALRSEYALAGLSVRGLTLLEGQLCGRQTVQSAFAGRSGAVKSRH